MSSSDLESAGEDRAAAEAADEEEEEGHREKELAGERDPVPTPLQAEEDKIVTQMYSVNDELVTYTFRLLEQCITLSDAVAEINQKVHTLPLRKTGQSVKDDLQHEAWKDLLSMWKSRVSCLSAEVVHVTADIRLSSIVENIHCDTPPPNTTKSVAGAGSAVSPAGQQVDQPATKPTATSTSARRAKSVAFSSRAGQVTASHSRQLPQQQPRQLDINRSLAPVSSVAKKSTRELIGKKATSSTASAPDALMTAVRRSNDAKLAQVLANYWHQLDRSPHEFKLPTIIPPTDGAVNSSTTTDKRWMSLPEVTSSSAAERGKNDNKISELAKIGGIVDNSPQSAARSNTAFPASRDRRKC